MDTEHKILALLLLKRLALSDHIIQLSEQAYLDYACSQLGIKSDVLENVDLDYMKEKSLPSAEGDRMTILYYVLFLAKADGVMLKEEKNEIQKIGFELGFRPDQVRSMIQVIDKNENQLFDPKELIDIIRTSLN